ncbi:MAG: xanthine dehydrogenase family protein subunit M [Acidobacteria bacterium]|nr:xanthine dehydrogenase family protein subunit M [Acidobacteriota bacterium]
MFPSEFDYVRAASAAEACSLLEKHPNAKLLAGGHSLIPLLKLRLASPDLVIDIGRIAELKGVSVSGSTLRIGSLTTHAAVATSPEVRKHAPALSEAAAQIGDPAVRNRGTIGGNVAHADPASDVPAVLVALGAALHITGSAGARSVAAAEFFQGMMATALGEKELLTFVELPVRGAGEGAAYVKFSHPASRYAVIGVAARLTVTGGVCSAASVVAGGLTAVPVRLSAVESGLIGKAPAAAVLAEAAAKAAESLDGDLLGDLFASADYRKAVAHVYVRRALTAAAGRAV